MTLPPWDGHDLAALLTLARIGPGHFRNRHGDANRNGRAYGGQTLGQALMAAAADVPDDRPPTMMQFVFLRGVQPERAIDFKVVTLQQGKRFTTRHVRGDQGPGSVFDAQVSFAAATPLFAHAAPLHASETDPESIAPFDGQLPCEQALARRSGYPTLSPPCIDFPMPDPERQIGRAAAGDRLHYWFRIRTELPASPALQAAALAYLSDWWINFPAVGPHLHRVPEGRRLYIASLNHALWLHRPFRADRWLHVSTESPTTTGSRGLCMARIHDQAGALVASATQECVMQIADAALV